MSMGMGGLLLWQSAFSADEAFVWQDLALTAGVFCLLNAVAQLGAMRSRR